MDEPALRVGLIGHGAIGSVIADALAARRVDGAALGGVLDPVAPREGHGVASVEELLNTADLVIEAAGHSALASYAPTVRAAGADLLVVSVGALADDELRAVVTAPAPGRVLLTTGAIGGFDTLRAAMLAGRLDMVSITSTKPARNLVRDWMTPEMVDVLTAGSEPVVAFEGTAREAARRFPESANVCATLALATVGLDATAARLVGDPAATTVRHVVAAEGAAGRYEFSFENRPSPANPKTSAITPYSVLRALGDLTNLTWSFV
jgi:aspartate dehydrogenase